MALKILLVDHDPEWLDTATKFLTSQFYEVKGVNNGKDAQLALYNDKYFAVIINWDVKNHAGSQVLKFIRTNYPAQRVVLILDNDSIITSGAYDDEKLKKIGATEILIRPFEMMALRDVLEGHQSLGDLVSNLPKKEGVSPEVEVSMKDDEFTSVKIDEFYSTKAVLFDIFIRLESGRYVKILHAGDAFTKERIDKYKNDKGVKELFFHNSDRRKFIQYNNYLTKKILSNKAVPGAQKVSMLKNVGDKFVQEVHTQGVKPQVIEQGKEVCATIFKFVEKQEDLYKILKDLEGADPNIFTHSFLVSLYATAIIKQFEWQSQITIESTALACLLHDIGKTRLPKEIIGLSPLHMSDEQFELYKMHPEWGAEIVEQNRYINNSVKQIIIQHHECFDGTGFPTGKKGSKILTLANIVRLADDFVHYMLEDELKPTEALKKILSNPEMVTRYNSTIIENFIRVFVDPAKIQKEVTVLPSNSKIVNKKAS